MGSFSTPYLIGYNLACCAGWAMILSMALPSVVSALFTFSLSELSAALASVYGIDGVSKTLTIVQSAAMLEIAHAVFGLVRSPVQVTSMQVGSRIIALFAINNSPSAQVQFGAGLMILSWAFVEVPRYAFYMAALITGDATKKTPYPLFWLRYSLFAVLYPTGITGEMTCFLAAAKDPAFLAMLGEGKESIMYYFIMFFPAIYVPGSPSMVMNMVGNRKSAMKKRFARPVPPPRGLVWPEVTEKNGKKSRSSTPTAKGILAAAIGSVNKEMGDKTLNLKNWRFGYVKFLKALVNEQCKSEEACLTAAKAGLEKAHSTFQFVAPDGSACSVAEAMSAKNASKFFTGYIKGTKSRSEAKLEIPYKGKNLSGDELKQQVNKWVDYGTIERSCGDAIISCIDNPEWLDLRDKYFVLLGAGSAMGPFLVLMALGANVVAIDLDRPHVWKRLINIARESSGSITFPMKEQQDTCKNDDELYAKSGSNLFTQTPLIKDWLLNLYEGKAFTVGCYAYLDGALHVQVSLAMDAICKELTEKRPNTSLAYLCTPTDLHLIPKEAHDAAEAEYKNYASKLYCMFIRLVSRGKLLTKNAMPPIEGEGGPFYVVNGISIAQGPNYAMAKRMQHWRAVVARSRGCIVSSNIAPSTSTVSVVSNKTFAWAYEGMPFFKPFEIFAPETSNAVMSAILFHDLNNEKSAVHPKQKLSNPNELFKWGSFHGGAWRCAYEVDSLGEASVLIYFSRLAAPYAKVAVAVGAIAYAKMSGMF
uniref:very-long-chain (3R)-3-hydroxyacyl-CoA dehydratase n=1 Tax=Proboscia inermis TaxID=420281 RepID=A0A6T8JQH9_9STRA|mmetsp:Transcript_30594/g.30916  ORF Transcript_30594/g.30916 Transcript_30594/m.30916 type:complete len:759 (+) Transcript_30594:74-2350(+)